MYELGLLEELLLLPHQKVSQINAQFGDLALTVADFNHLQTRCHFVVLMPQWDFLNFLTLEAARYPTFHLRMQAEVTGLIEEKERVVGLNAISSGDDHWRYVQIWLWEPMDGTQLSGPGLT